MDQKSDIESWRELIASLQDSSTEAGNQMQTFTASRNLFDHLVPQTAPRLQREYESCTEKTCQILSQLFDKIDLSHKPLLSEFLKLLRSFGYFRMAQIIYHVDSQRNEFDYDLVYYPQIEKVKWYDLGPLLPQAGTITWKSIMNHGLVKEEGQLMHACLQLLLQKLHFYSSLLISTRYEHLRPIIRRNGKKVSEKLFEIIRDVAFDDESMIGLNSHVFNLLLPFADESQLSLIVEACVQDLFKSHFSAKAIRNEDLDNLFELVNCDLVNQAHLQDLLITQLFSHLKCHIVKRKRRHSVESAQEDARLTLESLLDGVSGGDKLTDIMDRVDELSSKSIQSSYLDYWLKVMSRAFHLRVLTPANSVKILSTCFILLLTSSHSMSRDLVNELIALLVRTIENNGQVRLEKIFNFCDPVALIRLTGILCSSTQILVNFDTPMQQVYKLYLGHYVRWCLLRNSKGEIDKLVQFSTSICDKSIDRDTAHFLQFMCIHAISSNLDILKNKLNNPTVEILIECSKNCAKRLQKFIKRHSSLRVDQNKESIDDATDTDLDSSQQQDYGKCDIAIEALIDIIKISIECKDQQLLDDYSELLLRLFNLLKLRIEKLTPEVRNGLFNTPARIDIYLPKLLALYLEHKEMIKPYIDYDVIPTITSILSEAAPLKQNGDIEHGKKAIYSQIKAKLEIFNERAANSKYVYQTVINKQYGTIVEPVIGSDSDIRGEKKSCIHSYSQQMKLLREISTTILDNSDSQDYRFVLERVVEELRTCDPLNHPNIVYLLAMIEALIPRYNPADKDNESCQIFKDSSSEISSNLIRISKTVELGPSIRVFTRSGAHKSNRSVQCCTYSKCIRIYALIFAKHHVRLTKSLFTEAMQVCISANLIQYAKQSVRLHKFFVQLATSISAMLKSICIGRKDDELLNYSMPIFLSTLSDLIRCLIVASDRRKLDELDRIRTNGVASNHDAAQTSDEEGRNRVEAFKEFETSLEHLGVAVGKTLNDLSSLKIKLIEFAPNLICAYIKDIQRAPCPEFLKLPISEGIYRIFNLVDAHQKERFEEILEKGIQRKTIAGQSKRSFFEMIHARLDQASREIFKDMHDNYVRFHKYRGQF